MQEFKEKKPPKKLQKQNHKQTPPKPKQNPKQETAQSYYVNIEKKRKKLFLILNLEILNLEMHTISKDPY